MAFSRNNEVGVRAWGLMLIAFMSILRKVSGKKGMRVGSHDLKGELKGSDSTPVLVGEGLERCDMSALPEHPVPTGSIRSMSVATIPLEPGGAKLIVSKCACIIYLVENHSVS